jgi:hypothetical protein
LVIFSQYKPKVQRGADAFFEKSNCFKQSAPGKSFPKALHGTGVVE